MMNTKHTPGPWIYGPETWPDCTRIDSEGGRVIAAVRTREITSWEKSHPIYSWSYEGAANACLIAAAPELLEALSGLLKAVERGVLPESGSAQDAARAAIAKATGSAA